MLKKSLLSLAVSASLVGLTGCNISSTTENSGAISASQQANDSAGEQLAADRENVVSPVFAPLASAFPLGIDFLFAAQASDAVPTNEKDGTMNTGAEGGVSESPVTNALDDLDGGISTLAPIDIPMDGSIDPSTVVSAATGSSVILVKLPNANDIAGSNLVLPEGVSASDIDALDLASLGNFFSQLKQDNTAPANSTETVVFRNLVGTTFNGDPASITDGMVAMQPVPGVDYVTTVITQDNGAGPVEDNTIRIKPITPLDPKTKYVVVLTNAITGVDNPDTTDVDEALPIRGSVDYEYVTSSTDLFTSALAGVKASVEGWESMAGAILTLGGATPLPSGTDIAFTAGFTTVNPATVLKSMAYPGYWAATDVVGDAATAAGLQALAVAQGLTTTAKIDGLKQVFQSVDNSLALAENADELEVLATSYLINSAITTPATEGAAVAYESPRARNFELIDDVIMSADPLIQVDQVPLFVLNSATSVVGGHQVLVSQGGLELPQYTAALATDPNSDWSASLTVGAVLDSLAGNADGTTPPSDINGDRNVTYRYPFAAEQRDAVVPVMFIEPIDATKAADASFDALVASVAARDSVAGITGAEQAGSCAKPVGGWPVIISQHGFTVERSGTLLMGASLAINTCSVVVAMDLPHHGIAPRTTDRNQLEIDNDRLPLTITYNADTAATAPFAFAANAAATADSESILNNLQERHEGLYLDATQAIQAMTYGETKAGESGDFFIRLTNFQRTRDNLRQGVMDLLNLNATLATMDIDGDGTPDLDIDNVSFVGHSLGGIVGTTFVAVNNDETVQLASGVTQAAAMAATGGTLSETQYDAFYTLPKIQSAVLATPGGGLLKLLESSAQIGPSILGGLAVAAGIEPGDSSFESFMGVFQATVDTADPLNFVSDLGANGSSETPTMLIEMIGGGTISAADSNAGTTQLSDDLIALGIYPADTVVPNNATSNPVESAQVNLAGTDPMIRLLNSVEITSAGANQVQAYPVTKFNQGTHGTFSSADSAATFTEMVTETATFVGSGGAVITVANDGILGVAP